MSRKERLKVYHGIPKNVCDEHTLLYASFDGTSKPEVDNLYLGDLASINTKYSSSYTGYGITRSSGATPVISTTPVKLPNELTIECFVNPVTLKTKDSTLLGINRIDSKGVKRRAILFNIARDYTGMLLFDDTETGYGANVPGRSIGLSLSGYSDICHVRMTLNLVTKLACVYINGVLKVTSVLNLGGSYADVDAVFGLFTGFDGSVNTLNPNYSFDGCDKFCDLRISSIDRGDYFPNLPQDFLDGKAVIKPKIGQQQIKGDPFYSQVTKLRVPSNKDNTGNYSTIANPDGRFTHNQYPELSCLGASTWASGSTLKITGLNGEIISGVIDSNTALCRVVKPTVSAVAVNKATFYVDDTSKLSVGDTVRTVKADFSFIGGKEYTIESIVPNESFVGVLDTTSTINVTEDFLFFETTVTSSSPVVKTINNNTVVGTWTGLGTNEAIFTVGTNTSALVEGKDLVVTYSLHTKAGNSDFTELPYAISKVYDEVGDQLVEVTEIIIEDDFKSKVVGDTKICPHISGYAQGKVIPTPTDFTEISQDKYTAMKSADDIFSYITGSGGSTDHTYQLFSFNVAEMIYRKVGFKYLYLGSEVIDLIESVKIYWKGVSSSTTKPTCALYNYLPSRNGWQSLGTHANTSNTAIESSVDVNNIDTEGFMYFCASQYDTSGSIKTDYVKITIKLKKEANYSCFYVDNVRAREFPCNPVLIQKETKTVKRLIPSDKCFSTEYSYVLNAEPLSHAPILSGVKFKSIGLSTGEYLNSEYRLNFLPTISWYKSPKIVPYSAVGSYVRPVVTSYLNDLIWFTDNGANWKFNPHCEQPTYICVASTLNKTGGFSSASKIPFIYGTSDKNANVNQPILGYCLVRVGSELKIALVISQKGSFYFYEDKLTFVNLPNRPLIKQEGYNEYFN